MSTQHTPGPWHVGMKPGPILYGPQGEQVADLRGSLLDKDEALANMRLMKGAPAMLQSLKLAEEYLVQYYGEHHFVVTNVRQALAQAEGRGDK